MTDRETEHDARTHLGVKVLSERDRRAYDAAEVEYGPKDADEFALLVFGGVGEHQRTLRGPQQTCADPEYAACGDDKPTCVFMNVDCPGVKRVTKCQ